MRDYRLFFILGLCVAGAFFLFCDKAAKDQDRVVATVNDFKITYQDLSKEFRRARRDSSLENASEAAKRAVLDDMINEQITLFEAYRLGIDKDEKVLSVAREKERELAAKALRKQEVDDRVLTDELINRFYQWSDRELELFYMKFFAGNTSHGIDAAQQKADKIYQKLLSGADFKSLASMYSEHGAARADSGKIGRADCFTTQEAFFEHAYPLPEGGVSKPFLNNNSIWIVKVEKIYPVPRDSFDKARAEILNKVQELYSNRVAQRNMEFNEAIRAEFHFSLLSGHIDFFCKRCGTMKTLADSSGLFSLEEQSKVLCRNDAEETTIGAFFPKVAVYYWNSLDQQRVVEMLLTDFNTTRLVKHKAAVMGINETPDVKRDYENWLAYYLKKVVTQREVIDKMGPSDPVLRQLYEQSKPSLTIKRQATVREIFRKTKSGIDRVYQLAVSGQDFTALQKQYCQNQENRNNGIVGPFPAGLNGKLGELAFSGMRIGEISQPFKYRGGYSIIQLLALDPERVKSYAEAKAELKNDYVQANWEKKVSEWIDLARKNHKVRIRL